MKHFTRSLFSSYAFLGVNVVYTLASIPLALKYLSKAEFGLWALTLQIAGYIGMVDLGMNSSIGRILIDYKDQRVDGRYGGVIKSGFLVGAIQGLIVLLVGMSLVWFMASWLRVPNELSHSFLWLMISQVFITAATFITRMFGQVLVAWQRMDVFNYSQSAQLVAGFGALWLGFHLEIGVFSLVFGAFVGWGCGAFVCAIACQVLGLWPKAGEWGRMSWQQFRELFAYGADVFLISLGAQLIVSSQVLIVSRQLGMEAAALWSVMTKVFTLLNQIVLRIIGNAMPAFAEMQVRGEHDRLWARYCSLFITVNVFAGLCAVLFAACNGPFVSVWTGNRFSWPVVNNVLLGLCLIAGSQQCCNNSLIICLKQIGNLKLVFLAEGVVFVGMALAVINQTGITGMLVCSLLATMTFTWSNGLWRVGRLSGGNWKQLLWDWQLPMVWVVIVMVPVWIVAEWALRGAPDWLRLVVTASSLLFAGLLVSARYALPAVLVAELAAKLPSPLQRQVILLTRHARQQKQGSI